MQAVEVGPPVDAKQDGFAVEAEQAGYEAHYEAPMIEINPAIGLFQDLTIRKWEEYLAKADHDPAKGQTSEVCKTSEVCAAKGAQP
jgi:hypothetical protein